MSTTLVAPLVVLLLRLRSAESTESSPLEPKRVFLAENSWNGYETVKVRHNSYILSGGSVADFFYRTYFTPSSTGANAGATRYFVCPIEAHCLAGAKFSTSCPSS